MTPLAWLVGHLVIAGVVFAWIRHEDRGTRDPWPTWKLAAVALVWPALLVAMAALFLLDNV